MTTSVWAGAPIGGPAAGRVPCTAEQAVSRRRYWENFYRIPQQPDPVLTIEETTRLVRRAGALPGQVAVDVGCGRGDLAAALAHACLWTTGYDWARTAIDVARLNHSQPQLSYAVHDFLTGRAPSGVHDASVDLITCRSVVQYLDVPFWKAARHWLRPDTGVMYVVLPVNENHPEGRAPGLPEEEIEALRQGWAYSERWHLDRDDAYTALILRGALL